MNRNGCSTSMIASMSPVRILVWTSMMMLGISISYKIVILILFNSFLFECFTFPLENARGPIIFLICVLSFRNFILDFISLWIACQPQVLYNDHVQEKMRWLEKME